jgi:arginase
MEGFEVPDPRLTVTPNLPGNDRYDVAHADGPGGPAQIRMAVLYKELAGVVANGPPSLVYAGDCISVIGVLAGLQQAGIGATLYWFDAHGDFNTWETTPTGFLGGMPLAMLTGRGEQSIVEAVGLHPLDDVRVILVDARSVDDGEDEAIALSGIAVMSVDDVVASDPAPGPIYVHVDVDIVDPRDLPAVNYPAPEGPRVHAVAAAVSVLARSGRVVAASVSSWNPALEGAAHAAAVTRSIMEPLINGSGYDQ